MEKRKHFRALMKKKASPRAVKNGGSGSRRSAGTDPKRVRAILAKLEEGSYGRCDVCGDPIGEERLEVLPWAVLCVRDAGRR